MTVVDTSALVAVLLDEPDALDFREALAEAERCVISAVSLLETGIVLRMRHGPLAIDALSAFLDEARIEVFPFDQRQAAMAIEAFDRFGKGLGSKARLNFGDCASYALARALGVAMLFKGDDFRATDVQPVRSSL